MSIIGYGDTDAQRTDFSWNVCLSVCIRALRVCVLCPPLQGEKLTTQRESPIIGVLKNLDTKFPPGEDVPD